MSTLPRALAVLAIALLPPGPAAAQTTMTMPAPAAPAEEPAEKRERLVFALDDPNWDVALQQVGENRTLTEWMPDGQSAKAWREKLTYQTLEGLPKLASLDGFLEQIIEGVKKTCPTARLTFLRRSATDALYELVVKGCATQPDQNELVRVVHGRDATHTLHYAVRGVIEPARRNRWRSLLEQARIVRE
ncbi:MAG: hypothetical protein IPK81_21675 [Rhodospirillales bacterium]|nr:MAG: hypothetical protein IPK81_21675 [Rhodospirillales bacterium]